MRLLPIDKSEAFRYMGFKDSLPDESFILRTQRLEQELISKARPCFLWRTEELVRKDGRLFAGGIALEGRDIALHLEACSQAVILAATVSAEADRLIARSEAVNNITDAMILDALCSAAAEQVCNRAEKEISEALTGKYFTWRFSPGYGDFPLETQKAIAENMMLRKWLGITVTDSCLMIPRKSVTAVIGVSDTPIMRSKSGCVHCSLKDTCNFRRNGVHC